MSARPITTAQLTTTAQPHKVRNGCCFWQRPSRHCRRRPRRCWLPLVCCRWEPAVRTTAQCAALPSRRASRRRRRRRSRIQSPCPCRPSCLTFSIATLSPRPLPPPLPPPHIPARSAHVSALPIDRKQGLWRNHARTPAGHTCFAPSSSPLLLGRFSPPPHRVPKLLHHPALQKHGSAQGICRAAEHGAQLLFVHLHCVQQQMVRAKCRASSWHAVRVSQMLSPLLRSPRVYNFGFPSISLTLLHFVVTFLGLRVCLA